MSTPERQIQMVARKVYLHQPHRNENFGLGKRRKRALLRWKKSGANFTDTMMQLSHDFKEFLQ